MAFVLSVTGTAALAQLPAISVGPLGVELQSVASGLVSPLFLTHAGDGTSRLFIVEQTGLVRLVKNGVLQATPFLNVSALITPLNAGYDEKGLLGLAFHPGFGNPNSPGYRTLYTYETLPRVAAQATFTVPGTTSFSHQTAVVEWKASAADPDQVDPASRRILYRSDHPQGNHNAGMIAFDVNGYLYIADGDGGGSNDSGSGHVAGGNAQSLDVALGKILRIDPLSPALTPGSSDPISGNGQYRVPASNPFVGTAGLDEIYAYGLRNPYRFSFDAPTGRLIAADVGQNAIEEVDIITGGGNFGWARKEGTFTGPIAGDLTGLIDPVLQYDHDEGQSVIGGYVYRGALIPVLAGKYIFGDLGFNADGRLFYGDLTTGELRRLKIGLGTQETVNFYIKGFGQDAQGALYVMGSPNIGPSGTAGVVYRIIKVSKPGDISGDGQVNVFDLQIMAGAWNTQQGQPNYSPAADLTGDGRVNVFDLQVLAQNWNT